MTSNKQDFSVHLNYPALCAYVVDAAGAGDHDHCVTMAARQALEEQTSIAAEAMRVVGAVEAIGDSDHSGGRYSFDYLVTIEANGTIYRVRVCVDSAEASALLVVNERFTDDAACIVAVSQVS